MSFGTISATGKRFCHIVQNYWMKNRERKANEGVQQYTFLLESQKGWLGGTTEVPHTQSRTIGSIRSGQPLFMAIYLETFIIHREICARQRMDTKLNPGLEAAYLYCPNSVAVQLLGSAPCSFQSTVLNTAWCILQAFPSLMLAMRIQSQHVEDEKCRQEQGTVSQILLKKKGRQDSRMGRE